MKRFTNVYSLAASVGLLTLLVYLPALQNEFVNWDDNLYIFENPHIRSLDIAFLKWAFLQFFAGNWHPLTWISHALDYALWGLNPMGHHLTSVILHAINTFLVVVLVVRLLDAYGERRAGSGQSSFMNDRTTLIAAGTTGLLFGLHPLHVESVAWVAERKDLLCALFFLLSIITYTKYAGGQGSGGRQESEGAGKNEVSGKHFFINKHYLLSLVLFILALMSKPMAVSLPAVLLILDWHPFNRISSWVTFQRAGLEKLPFIAFSLISSMLTILAQRTGEAIQSMEFAPLSSRMLVGASSLVAYLRNMVWPLNLVPYYPYPEDASLLSTKYFFAVALLLGITISSIVLIKNRKLWLAAWIYYVVTLIPVIGIVQVGKQAMADRYTYLPSLGPFVILGLLAAWAAKEVKGRTGSVISAFFFASAAILVTVSLSFLTLQQIELWKNSITLWNAVIENHPGVALAYNNRGFAFERQGQFDQAIADYDKSIALKPSSYSYVYYNNRGSAFRKKGMINSAISDFNKSISLDPSYFPAYNNRGLAFEDAGLIDEAMESYDRAIFLNPSDYAAYNNKGALYAGKGLFAEAIESFTKSIAAEPHFADAYYNRGVTNISIGQVGAALEDFTKVILLNKNDVKAYVDRGKLYFSIGNKDLALSDFKKACDLGDSNGCNALHELTRGGVNSP